MSKADRLYIVALETVHSDDTTIFFEADGRLVDCLYAIVQVTPKGAGIVDNCYRSVAEALAAWPDAISPEAPTIEGDCFGDNHPLALNGRT
jgi:hypothetical protein